MNYKEDLMTKISRRQLGLTAAALGLPVLQGCASIWPQDKVLSVGALFAGQVNDKGFMESGWRGLERARTELGVKTHFIDSVVPKKELLAQSLTVLANSGVDLVIAHGGQNNEACAEVASKFPNVKFVVIQGGVTAANLASYEVLQEESAYLGGVLAALTTRSGVVGHMSGIRVRPGLKGRAAFVAGVKATNANVKVLTNFSGNQDDNALSKRVALAEISEGADCIFTMLNAGRGGAIEACREKGVRQIGNVVDWVQTDPQVFVASAIADVSMAVLQAIRDLKTGQFELGKIQKVGLQNTQAVRLTMAADVPNSVRQQIAKVSEDIQAGKIKIPETYTGPEFATPPMI
jgi:basic membrane protein A